MQTATIYNHETVVLDGESFEDCDFRECRLVYSGGEPPHFRTSLFRSGVAKADHAGRDRVAVEDLVVAVQGVHAFLDARPARVEQADDGTAVLVGQVKSQRLIRGEKMPSKYLKTKDMTE